MKKRFFAILLVLVLLTAVTGLSCEPTPQGTIEVKATLCGEPWEGDVAYTLTGTEEPIDGTSVPKTHSVTPDRWICAYVSGGPAGAYFVDITPLATQTLIDGGTITFTLNFELEQDASIDFLTWTINGEPVEPNGPDDPYYVTCGAIIDVHFKQHVAGCEGVEVSLVEYSWFELYHTGGYIDLFDLHVLNEDGAVVKTPDLLDPIEPSDQNLWLWQDMERIPVEFCDWFYFEALEPCEDPATCDPLVMELETVWTLEKCTDYEKTINWLRIGECLEPVAPIPVLFEAFFDAMDPLNFTLVSRAEVELLDDEDANPDNNFAESPPLYLVFEPEMDASIEFDTWTINGVPLDPQGPAGEIYYEAEVTWGDIIDVHFAQHVAGCKPEAYVIEYSRLDVLFTEGAIPFVGLHVYDGPCGVSKDPDPLEEVYRYLFVDGEPVEYCRPFDLFPFAPRILEVETLWLLEKNIDYTKTINWLVIGECFEPEPWCVLFDLWFEFPGVYQFILVASAGVELKDDEDVNLDNNYTESPPLYLTVFVP